MAAPPEVHPLLQSFTQAITSERFDTVAAILDRYELQTGEFGAVNFHLLGHIFNNNLEDARFLWKRLTVPQQQAPDMPALFTLLQILWQKDYQDLWAVLGRQEWSQPLLPMVNSYSAKLKQDMVKLLAHAYSTLSVSTAVALTGYSDPEATQVLIQEGWTLDEALQSFKLQRKPQRPHARTSLSDLGRLTEYVVHLESG